MNEKIEIQREEMAENFIAINEIEKGRNLIFLPCLPGIYTCLNLTSDAS
jgi:hypothetical protein